MVLPTLPLDGKIALVTGASRGIGRAAAIALAKIGAAVAVNYKAHAQEAEAVCAEIKGLGGRAVASAHAASSLSRSEVAEPVQLAVENEHENQSLLRP